VIAFAVLILSLLWIGFAFGYIPGPGDAMGDSGLWIALGIDIVILVIIAVVLASRRRFAWSVAMVFDTGPLIHFAGNFVGEIRILFFEFPCAAVIVVVMAHYGRRLFQKSPHVT